MPNATLKAPYLIACGDFLPAVKGDELAVTNAFNAGDVTVSIFDFVGQLQKIIVVPATGNNAISMASAPDKAGARLALYFRNGKMLCEITPSTGKIARRSLTIDAARQAVYPTAFAPDDWLAICARSCPLMAS